MLNRLIRNSDGQDLIEYALLAAIIAIVSVAVFPSIQTKMANAFNSWVNTPTQGVQKVWTPCDPGVSSC